MTVTVGAILEIQAKEGKTIPSIQKDPSSNSQAFLEPLLARFGTALKASNLSVEQLDQAFDAQLLLRVIQQYGLKTPEGMPFLKIAFRSSKHNTLTGNRAPPLASNITSKKATSICRIGSDCYAID